MPGIRIHHPEARDVVLLIPHPGDPETGRAPKDYHIHVDADGYSIVSETVWRRLEEARGSGLSPHQFLVVNEVPDPPALVISQAEAAPLKRVMVQTPDGIKEARLQEAAQLFAPRGVTARITRRKR